MNKCVKCGHKHNTKCTTVLANGKKCGCQSHSSKWDSGAKKNPGDAKRDRMIDRLSKRKATGPSGPSTKSRPK